MEQPEIYAILNSIFREVFDDESIVLSAGTTAHDIREWDSFNHINLIVASEIRFGLKFRTSEIERLKNVGDFVDLIDQKLSK